MAGGWLDQSVFVRCRCYKARQLLFWSAWGRAVRQVIQSFLLGDKPQDDVTSCLADSRN